MKDSGERVAAAVEQVQARDGGVGVEPVGGMHFIQKMRDLLLDLETEQGAAVVKLLVSETDAALLRCYAARPNGPRSSAPAPQCQHPRWRRWL